MTEPIKKQKGRPKGFAMPEAHIRKIALGRKRKQECTPESLVRYYNRHRLPYYIRPEDKVVVLGWIQPEGEEEIVSSIAVEKSEVDSVTLDVLMKAYRQNKVQQGTYSTLMQCIRSNEKTSEIT